MWTNWTREAVEAKTVDGKLVLGSSGTLAGNFLYHRRGLVHSLTDKSFYLYNEPVTVTTLKDLRQKKQILDISKDCKYFAWYENHYELNISTRTEVIMAKKNMEVRHCRFIGDSPKVVYYNDGWMKTHDPLRDVTEQLFQSSADPPLFGATDDWILTSNLPMWHIASREFRGEKVEYSQAALNKNQLVGASDNVVYVRDLLEGTTRKIYKHDKQIARLVNNDQNRQQILLCDMFGEHVLDVEKSTFENPVIAPLGFQAETVMKFDGNQVFDINVDSDMRWRVRTVFSQWDLLPELLVHLELEELRIEDPTPLLRCRLLEFLNLAENLIKDVPHMLAALPLVHLDLRGNECEAWMPKSAHDRQPAMNASYLHTNAEDEELNAAKRRKNL